MAAHPLKQFDTVNENTGSLMNADWTPEEMSKLVLLRSLEWTLWPEFIAQPLIPLLYLRFNWWVVVLSIGVATAFWSHVCTRFANLRLANASALFVRIKWITIPIGAFILWRNGRIATAALAVVTPLVTGFFHLPFKLFGYRVPPMGPIQEKFFAQLHAARE
jgi:hypothetical protein